MDKKLLCLVIPSLHVGGMERVMSELAGYLCQKNELEVHMILYGRAPQLFYRIPKNLYLHTPKTKFNNRFRLIYTIGRLWFLRRQVADIKPYSILSFGEYWNSFVLIALSGFHFPVFISDRCSPEKKLGIFPEWLRRRLYPRAESVIVQSEMAKDFYSQIFNKEKIQVIGNPIRFIDYNTNTKKENIIITVGRLISSKNHDKLIELFLSINKPDWRLIIVGGDALKQKRFEKLKTLVKELGGVDKVILTDVVTDIDQYYQKSKIFAFTSSSEGFPNVLGEAMSAGLPVIAFNCIAGPSEMVKDGENGFLVPVFDYDLFKTKLEQLMDDEPLRYKFGQNAKESIKRFSIENIGSAFSNLLLQNN